MKKRSICLVAGLLAGLVVSSASAANRFFVNNATLDAPSSGNKIAILADCDQELLAFSVHLVCDSAKVQVKQVDLGAAVKPLSPEFPEQTFPADWSTPGDFNFGIVFDMSDPLTKTLAKGTTRELLVLTVDVVATADTTAVLDFKDAKTPVPAKINVMTGTDGLSIEPALVDATLTLKKVVGPQPPVIDSLLNNSGCPGDQFIIVGQNFDQPGLQVKVCNVVAEAELFGVGGLQIRVTAPGGCAVGWARVDVQTNAGSDSEVQGFSYDSDCDGTPFVRGNANNQGAVDISDGITILNDLFLGTPAGAPCRDALDANDSGTVDISDGIYLLNFLFLGGQDIPPPYPNAGLDPTPDPLPEC